MHPGTQEQALRSSLTTPYNKAHQHYALFTAFATLLVSLAGALMTSNVAGLAFPAWPASFHGFRMRRMIGGVLFEGGHRMIDGFTDLLTLGIAILTLVSLRLQTWRCVPVSLDQRVRSCAEAVIA